MCHGRIVALFTFQVLAEMIEPVQGLMYIVRRLEERTKHVRG